MGFGPTKGQKFSFRRYLAQVYFCTGIQEIPDFEALGGRYSSGW